MHNLLRVLIDAKPDWIHQRSARAAKVKVSQLLWLHLFWRAFSSSPIPSFANQISLIWSSKCFILKWNSDFFHCTSFPLHRIIQVNSAVFNATIDWEVDIGAGKVFSKPTYPLCIFFQADLCHLLVLIHSSYSVYLVPNKSMCCISLAQLWQSCKAAYILQLNKLGVLALKQRSCPEFCCMLAALHLWVSAY